MQPRPQRWEFWLQGQGLWLCLGRTLALRQRTLRLEVVFSGGFGDVWNGSNITTKENMDMFDGFIYGPENGVTPESEHHGTTTVSLTSGMRFHKQN